MPDIQEIRPSRTHRLLPVSSANIVPGIVANSWILVVRGTLPSVAMTAKLQPVIYVRQPEYWEIEVVGTAPGGVMIPEIGRYSVSLPLANVTGSRGIEVVGLDYDKRFDVPPKKKEPTTGPAWHEEVRLPLGKKIAVDNGALDLELVDVVDDRCPSDVVCIWQGYVAATIRATPRKGDAEVVELTDVGPQPVELKCGYVLKLVSVMPYPRVEGERPPTPHVATVLVMRPE